MKQQAQSKSPQQQVEDIDLQIKRLTISTAVVSMGGLLCCYVDNEIYFNFGLEVHTSNNVFRSMGVISTLLLICLIFKFYQYQLVRLKIQNIVHHRTSLFQTKLKNQLLFETIANIIIYPPLLNIQLKHNFNETLYQIPMGEYIFGIMLTRLYILLRIFQQNTFWNTAKAQRVCKMNDFEPSLMFTIRVSLLTNPFWVVSVVLLAIIGVFGVAIRNLERYHLLGTRAFDFDTIWNSFWCIVLSLTTIGYGDIYPISIGGRFVVILAGISGFLILSMLVNILQSLTLLRPNEDQAYTFLVQRVLIDNKLYLDSIIFIQKQFRLLRLRSLNRSPRTRMQLVMDSNALIKRLEFKRMQIQSNKLGLTDLIIQIGAAYECEMGKLKEEVQDLTELKESVESSLSLQRTLNSKTLAIYRNQKYLYDLTQQNLMHDGLKTYL